MEPAAFHRSGHPNDIHDNHGDVYVAHESIGEAALLDDVVQRLVKGDISFPLKRKCMTLDEVRRYFKELQHLRYGIRDMDYVLLPSVYATQVSMHKGRLLHLPPPALIVMALSLLSQDAAPVRFLQDEGRSDVAFAKGAIPASSSDYLKDLVAVAGQRSLVLPHLKRPHTRFAATTDYFTEYARSLSWRPDEGASPIALLQQPAIAQKVVDTAARKYEEVSDFSLRYALFNHVAGCNVFKPEVAAAAFSLFQATRVLDISAGWGDRLLGALAAPTVQRYLAFDPNTALEKGHMEMINTLAPLRAKPGR